jgi:hypothetical protein
MRARRHAERMAPRLLFSAATEVRTMNENNADSRARKVRSIAPERLSRAQRKAIRRRYENDPAIPKLAAKLGLTREELLHRLETQGEPTFRVAQNYDRDADERGFRRLARRVRGRLEYRAGESQDSVTKVKSAPKVAPKSGELKGRIEGPVGAAELKAALFATRLRHGTAPR